jgi:hypothetical protein
MEGPIPVSIQFAERVAALRPCEVPMEVPAEMEGPGGARFLEVMHLGIEVACRVSFALSRRLPGCSTY